MLFDLRGRGRRRTVQAIYLGLAVLIGLGLVGFGVGAGGLGGGLFNALEKERGGASGFAKQVASAEKRTKRHPGEAAAWAKLVEVELRQAGEPAYYQASASELTPGKYTSKGKELLHEISNAWNRYLQLEPDHPSPTLANLVIRIFDEEGLNDPAEEVTAMQIVIPSRAPSEALYAQLAEFAYKAKNTRIGDLASAKATALAPRVQRKRLKTYFESLKSSSSSSSSSPSSSGGTVTVK